MYQFLIYLTPRFQSIMAKITFNLKKVQNVFDFGSNPITTLSSKDVILVDSVAQWFSVQLAISQPSPAAVPDSHQVESELKWFSVQLDRVRPPSNNTVPESHYLLVDSVA